MTIHINTQGADLSAAERAVFSDLSRALIGIHSDRQKPVDVTPSMADMASGLVGMLAERNWKESDPAAYAVIIGCAALLYIESGAAVVAKIPADGRMH